MDVTFPPLTARPERPAGSRVFRTAVGGTAHARQPTALEAEVVRYRCQKYVFKLADEAVGNKVELISLINVHDRMSGQP